MITVALTPLAEADLTEITRYIAQHHPGAARQFYEVCLEVCQSLAQFPLSGPLVESDPAGLLRRIVVSRFRNYCIFYRSYPDKVVIVRVLNVARDVRRILADSNPDESQ